MHRDEFSITGKVLPPNSSIRVVFDARLAGNTHSRTHVRWKTHEREHILVEPLVLQGKTPREVRDRNVRRFQEDSASSIFLLSLKAAGVGLNLTRASHVIHFDLWWNPSVENQATDRAYRIGQRNTVHVHRFITSGSFETHIDRMMKRKAELGELAIASGESWLADLSAEDIGDMFSIGSAKNNIP